MKTKLLRFATRPSALARWQTRNVIETLEASWGGVACEEIVITTKGDQILEKPLPDIGGKGLFTFELEQALRERRVDAAVHSLKDLPVEDAPGLVVAVIPERVDPRDVWICPSGYSVEELPAGSVVGTSSNRRRAQLLSIRPDLRVDSIRGNIDTRVRKVQEGQYDAIILAAAGVSRLGLSDLISSYLSLDWMLPAPGQGALAVQCRADDNETLGLFTRINHEATFRAVTAERAFLRGLGGGCSLPIGAFASAAGEGLKLSGVIGSLDGKTLIRLEKEGDDPFQLGAALAQQALDLGARDLLK